MPISYEQVISVVANTRDAVNQFRRLNKATSEFGKSYREVERDVGRFTRAQNRIEATQRRAIQSANRATKSNEALASSYKLLQAGIAVLVTRSLIDLTVAFSRTIDSINLLSERMEVLTGSSGQFQTIVRIGNETGRSFEQIGTVATRLALSMEEIGAQTSEINDVSRAVFQLARISGSTSRELEAGSLQFAQGLAASRLAGDELRSVMENLPALAKAIAEELGVGTQELRDMGASGELTGRRVFEAVLAQVTEINEQFSQLDFTIEQTFTVFTNSLKLLVSSFDQAVGTSEAFKWLIDLTTGALNDARFAIDPDSFTQLDRLERRAREISSELAEIRREEIRGVTVGGSPRARAAGLDQTGQAERRAERRARLERELLLNLRERQDLEAAIAIINTENSIAGRIIRDQKEAERKQAEATKKFKEEEVKVAQELERVEASLLSRRERILKTYQDQVNLIKSAGDEFRLAGGLGDRREQNLGRARARRDEALAALDEAARREREAEQKRLRDRITQQNRAALDERQRLQQVFSDRLQLASDARRIEAVTEQEARDFALRAREDFQRRLSEIDKRAQEERQRQREQEAEEERRQREESIAGYATALAGFGALSAQVLGENATVTKAIRVAETIINTSAAIMRAYAEIPSPANVAAAAGIAALGAAQIARIRSTDIKGRASGGFVSGSEAYRVNEMRPELFTDRSGRQYLLPTANGRVSPLGRGTSATNVTSNVRIINNGAPLRVEQVRQRGNDTEIIVAQAVAAARQDFANSIASGYGTYSESLNRAGLRRRL